MVGTGRAISRARGPNCSISSATPTSAAITELVAPDPDDLRRWVAVDAVARIAEGIAADALLAIWHDTRSPGLSPVLDDGP